MADELGFIVEEDQSDKPMPDAEGWQDQFNSAMKRGWKQGHKFRSDRPEGKLNDNPYTLRDMQSLDIMTLALGWEDGFIAADSGQSEDDCPYP